MLLVIVRCLMAVVVCLALVVCCDLQCAALCTLVAVRCVCLLLLVSVAVCCGSLWLVVVYGCLLLPVVRYDLLFAGCCSFGGRRMSLFVALCYARCWSRCVVCGCLLLVVNRCCVAAC